MLYQSNKKEALESPSESGVASCEFGVEDKYGQSQPSDSLGSESSIVKLIEGVKALVKTILKKNFHTLVEKHPCLR